MLDIQTDWCYNLHTYVHNEKHVLFCFILKGLMSSQSVSDIMAASYLNRILGFLTSTNSGFAWIRSPKEDGGFFATSNVVVDYSTLGLLVRRSADWAIAGNSIVKRRDEINGVQSQKERPFNSVILLIFMNKPLISKQSCVFYDRNREWFAKPKSVRSRITHIVISFVCVLPRFIRNWCRYAGVASKVAPEKKVQRCEMCWWRFKMASD